MAICYSHDVFSGESVQSFQLYFVSDVACDFAACFYAVLMLVRPWISVVKFQMSG